MNYVNVNVNRYENVTRKCARSTLLKNLASKLCDVYFGIVELITCINVLAWIIIGDIFSL